MCVCAKAQLSLLVLHRSFPVSSVLLQGDKIGAEMMPAEAKCGKVAAACCSPSEDHQTWRNCWDLGAFWCNSAGDGRCVRGSGLKEKDSPEMPL